jgi:hypothetical protein
MDPHPFLHCKHDRHPGGSESYGLMTICVGLGHLSPYDYGTHPVEEGNRAGAQGWISND